MIIKNIRACIKILKNHIASFTIRKCVFISHFPKKEKNRKISVFYKIKESIENKLNNF